MKRDTKYQIDLLKEIEDYADAIYMFAQTFGMDEESQKKWQHLQLLADEGLVEKLSDHGYRLKALGHDVLDMHREGLIEKAIDKLGDAKDIGWIALIETVKTGIIQTILDKLGL